MSSCESAESNSFRVAPHTDFQAQFTSVDDMKRGNSVTFNSTWCRTDCWKHSSCPYDPYTHCSESVISPFMALANATYGGPCGAGAWWNATVHQPSPAQVTPSVIEVTTHSLTRECHLQSYCFSQDGKTPYMMITNQLNVQHPVVVKVVSFVNGPPAPSHFFIPSYCPCSNSATRSQLF